MSADLKKSTSWAAVLIVFGLIALFGGVKSLAVLIPAAVLVWFAAKPPLRTGRN